MRGLATLPVRRILRGLDGGPRAERRRSPTRAVLQFASAGVVTVGLLAGAGAFAADRAARSEAVDEARRLSGLLARVVVQPALTDGLVAGAPGALSEFDAVVRARVLSPEIVRAKVWTVDGRILYADDHRLIGSAFPLGADARAVLERGGVHAELSDLSRPENRLERSRGRLLEVYSRIHTPNGTPLLFETYAAYSTVTKRSHAIWWEFVPITVGLLLVLQLIQVPLAGSMARRLERGRRDRERLLRQAIVASETERRRIAHDLHDGVVQDLVGVSYLLVGVAESAARTGPAELAGQVEAAATDLRASIRALRSLFVEIYPPNLRAAGLQVALGDLVASLPNRGVAVELRVSRTLPVCEEHEALVYRVAQEAVRNVVRHARASRLSLRLDSGPGCTVLVVADDGVGFSAGDPTVRAAAVQEGHVGLALLGELAGDLGARLDVDSTVGGGTRIRLAVPAR